MIQTKPSYSTRKKIVSTILSVAIGTSSCQFSHDTKSQAKGDDNIASCLEHTNLASMFLENYIDQVLHRDHIDFLAKMNPQELANYNPGVDRKIILSVWEGVRKLQLEPYATKQLKQEAMTILKQEARIDFERFKALANLASVNLKQASREKKLRHFQALLGISKNKIRFTQKDLLTISQQKLDSFDLGQAIRRFHGFDQGKVQGFIKRNFHLKSFRDWVRGQSIAMAETPSLSFNEVSERILRDRLNADGRISDYPFSFAPTPAGYQRMVQQYLSGSTEERAASEKFTLLLYESFMKYHLERLNAQTMTEMMVDILPYVDRYWRISGLATSETLSPEVEALMPYLQFTKRLINHPNPTKLFEHLASYADQQAYFLIQIAGYDLYAAPGKTMSSLLADAKAVENAFKTSSSYTNSASGGFVVRRPQENLELISLAPAEQEILQAPRGASFLRRLVIISAGVGLISASALINLASLLPKQ
jgi:hypothetical protein